MGLFKEWKRRRWCLRLGIHRDAIRTMYGVFCPTCGQDWPFEQGE